MWAVDDAAGVFSADLLELFGDPSVDELT